MVGKLAKDFRSFAELASAYARDRDYRIVTVRRDETSTAIIAPQGGSIEAHTANIAQRIAGNNFSLYLFEGLLKAGNFAALHLSSHLFDEPQCLDTISTCDRVVAVHGCSTAGEVVLLGGRDHGLRDAIGTRLKAAQLDCHIAPQGLDAADARDICNRGRSGRGVQLEISLGLRQSPRREALIRAVREALSA